LEIWLECPSGQIVPLVNSYGAGAIPGGNSGGGTYLGHPIDDSGGGGPGEGWEYCFSSVFNTINGSMTQNLGNTVPVANQPPLSAGTSIDPSDTYQPESAFSTFAGCPINGVWTIHVQDNLGIDDGYIFEWGLFFDASFFPGLGSYQTEADTSWWSFDPTIISGQNDTLIVVQPNQTGVYSYTFNIIDNFGCAYDTSVAFVVLPLANIFDDTIACNQTFQVSGTSAFNGGVWSAADTAISISNISINNPIISTSTPGIYEVVFTDNQCNYSDTGRIEFPPYVYVQVLDTVLCENDDFELNPLTVNSGPLQAGYNPSYTLTWEDGSTDSIRVVNQPGNYIATISNYCYSYSDTATIENKICEITAPNIVVLSSQAGNNTFFVNYSGLESFNCVITNRWGNVIYEFSDPAGFWDGKTQGGTLVEEGVYFYRIKAKFEGGEDVKLHGFVHLKY
jgi:hypothetical protein